MVVHACYILISKRAFLIRILNLRPKVFRKWVVVLNQGTSGINEDSCDN